MALATLIAITLSYADWSLWVRPVTWTCRWEVAATLNIALHGAAVFLMSPFASETIGHWVARPDRKVEPRGLPRPRLLRRRGVGDRLQRDRPARGRQQDAVDVQTPRRDSGDAVCPVTVGDVLHGQRRDRLSVGLLRGPHRPRAEPLLAAVVRHPHLTAGLRC